LLLAIPLTMDEFYSDCELGSRKEYARLFRAQLASLPMSQVWTRYERIVVTPALHAVRIARSRGALIYTRASVSDWREAVRARQVVSLVAHWRAAGFTAELIRAAPEIVTDMATSPARVASAMRRAVTDTTSSASALATGLNKALRGSLLSPGGQDGAVWVANDPEQRFEKNWQCLRQEFPGWGLPESGMELSDGSLPASSMADAFPGDYTGTQDLRMCHSVILGEAIKRAAPRSRVVMNQRPVRPHTQLALYGAVLEMLATGRYEFAEAVLALNAAVMRRAR